MAWCAVVAGSARLRGWGELLLQPSMAVCGTSAVAAHNAVPCTRAMRAAGLMTADSDLLPPLMTANTDLLPALMTADTDLPPPAPLPRWRTS
jgi:hypothetical protein